MSIKNPFPVTGYLSPEYFCDREIETENIISALESGRNITLLSLRRMGKTGLIKHIFQKLEKEKNCRLLYLDIMATSNTAEFIKEFSKAIVQDEHKKSSNFLKRIVKFLSGIRAKLVFNELTGIPEIEFDYTSRQQTEAGIEAIFEYLKEQKKEYIIAIDEFQQIVNYPEKNLEALLRSHIQQISNVKFIFSGSNKHLLVSMFGEYGRPFYQSGEILYLNRLDKDVYADFIIEKFTKSKKIIERNLVLKMLEKLDTYTFYVQYFFNRLFEKSSPKITEEFTEKVLNEILEGRGYVYMNYKNLLTTAQFSLLKAVAKEETAMQINSKYFIKKYDLSAASTVNRSLKALLDKEMIYEEDDFYRVYDIFFEKWLQKL